MKDILIGEYNNARLIQATGIPMPKVYKIVRIGVRTGIIYDKLQGQSMLEKLLQGEDVNLLCNQIVDLHKKILGYNTCEVMSYKEFLLLCIGEKTNANVDIYNEIEGLPEGNSLCHGSWQYDVARTYFLISEGDVPQEIPDREKIIDMQKQLGEMYLKKLNISYNEISEYVSLIKKCREYELQ